MELSIRDSLFVLVVSEEMCDRAFLLYSYELSYDIPEYCSYETFAN